MCCQTAGAWPASGWLWFQARGSFWGTGSIAGYGTAGGNARGLPQEIKGASAEDADLDTGGQLVHFDLCVCVCVCAILVIGQGILQLQRWVCVFLPCQFFSLRGRWGLGEPYPRIIPRTIPPNHTPSHTP